VLAKYGTSPVPPESDEEKTAEEADKKTDDAKPAAKNYDDKTQDKDVAKGDEKKDAAKKDEVKPTVIDLPGIGNRILALPIPARNYVDLQVGKTGVIFLAEGSPVGRVSGDRGAPIRSLWRFTTEKRKTEEIFNNLTGFAVSANGEQLLAMREGSWFITPIAELKTGSPEAPQGKPINNGGMFATIDLRQEWKQQYRETWRIQRDFFYDPHLHGLDVQKISAKYEPYLDGLASRSEFTYLCNEMLGEIQVGHMFIRGPEDPDKSPKPGMLGADYIIAINSRRSITARTGPQP